MAQSEFLLRHRLQILKAHPCQRATVQELPRSKCKFCQLDSGDAHLVALRPERWLWQSSMFDREFVCFAANCCF